MSSIASPAAAVSPAERLEVLFEELAELAGQRNAIDGRIVQIVAELERDELCGTRRPHGQHTTVVVHLDVAARAAALHLVRCSPRPNADTCASVSHPVSTRRINASRVTCDATCEVWFERAGEVIGAGRTTRQINRRLRRASARLANSVGPPSSQCRR